MFNLQAYKNFELTDSDFDKISRLVYDQCGINLHDGKKELVKARLGKRLRKGQFKSFRDYYQYVVKDETGQELVYLLDSISTNFTFFFREQKHFDYLRSEFLPELMTRKRASGNRIRIWSAGCSSGEEPYSIGITLLETVPNHLVWDMMVMATDISTKVLKMAAAGIYHKERIHSMPQALVKKYFLKGEHDYQDFVKAKDHLKQVIQFKRLNFMEPFNMKESFDCIFCRNVMIYFDKKTQGELVNRFYECLEEGGSLLIGHSESLTGITHPFHYVRPAIYKK
jgi:chemotaxis protein methyltransferase CheR